MELPKSFEIQMKKIIGNELDAFVLSLNEESPVSIRLNPFKYKGTPLFEYKEKIDWASHAYYLNKRPVFTLDPLFHSGAYYVQEAASMYLEEIIRKHITYPVKVLDLCAAPGGKSTHLSSILPEESLLVANEVIRPRARILYENLTKWGKPNTIVTNNDPATLGKLDSYFDIIVADVPCSGEGMFRKDPITLNEWSINGVRLCAERQKRIIADIWPALKSGGILIYSTCTYNQEENENNIHWICDELGADITEAPFHFFPHKTKGEGFFIAAIKKRGNEKYPESEIYSKKKERKNDIQTINIPGEMKLWLQEPSSFSFSQNKDTIIAIPSIHMKSYQELSNSLRIVSGGIKLGEIKRKDIIPSHELAMSTAFNTSSFPVLELEKRDVLSFLHKDQLAQELFSELPYGHILITYKQYSLGFVKNIRNRNNNLYPNDWRIRMHIEKEI